MSDERLAEFEPLRKWIHELNNHVGIILATAELLQLEQLSPKAADRTRNIEHEALVLRELALKIAGRYLESTE
jgi:hypothetical protein